MKARFSAVQGLAAPNATLTSKEYCERGNFEMAVKVCLPFIKAGDFDGLQPHVRSNLVECVVNAIDQLNEHGQQELAKVYFSQLPQNCFGALRSESFAKAKNMPGRLGISEGPALSDLI